MSIQSATERGDSGIDNLTYLSGDETNLGTDHAKTDVYESSNNMSVGSYIGENQVQSDSDLEDDLFSLVEDDDIFSDSDDGAYILAHESLEGTLDASFKSIPCTVVSSQEKHSLTDLDPSAVLRSSDVPDPSDKWEDVDLGSYCVLINCLWSLVTMNSFYPAPLILLVPLLMQLTMLKILLGDILHLNTYFLQRYLKSVMMQILFGLF